MISLSTLFLTVDRIEGESKDSVNDLPEISPVLPPMPPLPRPVVESFTSIAESLRSRLFPIKKDFRPPIKALQQFIEEQRGDGRDGKNTNLQEELINISKTNLNPLRGENNVRSILAKYNIN